MQRHFLKDLVIAALQERAVDIDDRPHAGDRHVGIEEAGGEVVGDDGGVARVVAVGVDGVGATVGGRGAVGIDRAGEIAERPLPRYAPAFRLDRYDDPAYQKLLESWGDSGQL